MRKALLRKLICASSRALKKARLPKNKMDTQVINYVQDLYDVNKTMFEVFGVKGIIVDIEKENAHCGCVVIVYGNQINEQNIISSLFQGFIYENTGIRASIEIVDKSFYG